MYESEYFYKPVLSGLEEQSSARVFIPMILITSFILCEIIPFVYVLDWHFMEIFTSKTFPSSVLEPLFEQPASISMMSESMHRVISNNNEPYKSSISGLGGNEYMSGSQRDGINESFGGKRGTINSLNDDPTANLNL
jgi:hypothetical protein